MHLTLNTANACVNGNFLNAKRRPHAEPRFVHVRGCRSCPDGRGEKRGSSALNREFDGPVGSRSRRQETWPHEARAMNAGSERPGPLARAAKGLAGHTLMAAASWSAGRAGRAAYEFSVGFWRSDMNRPSRMTGNKDPKATRTFECSAIGPIPAGVPRTMV